MFVTVEVAADLLLVLLEEAAHYFGEVTKKDTIDFSLLVKHAEQEIKIFLVIAILINNENL